MPSFPEQTYIAYVPCQAVNPWLVAVDFPDNLTADESHYLSLSMVITRCI